MGNGKIERFIVMEGDKGFTAMRVVAAPEDIEKERVALEQSGRYESVVTTARA